MRRKFLGVVAMMLPVGFVGGGGTCMVIGRGTHERMSMMLDRESILQFPTMPYEDANAPSNKNEDEREDSFFRHFGFRGLEKLE